MRACWLSARAIASQLALGIAQPVDARVERQRGAEPRERLCRSRPHGGPVEHEAAEHRAAGRQMAEHDILGDRQGGHQAQLLRDHDDAGGQRGPRIGERARRAVQHEAAGVGLMLAAQDLDQGRFSGAVFADQRVDRAARQGQRDVAQGLGRVEAFRDPVDREMNNRQRATRATVMRGSTRRPRSTTRSLSSITLQSRIGTS